MKINFIIIRRGSEHILMMRNHKEEKPIEYINANSEEKSSILKKANRITERVDRELKGQ